MVPALSRRGGEPRATQVHALEKVLEFGRIYREHFSFIDTVIGDATSVEPNSQQRKVDPDIKRAPKSITVFSISAVVIDITNLREHPILLRELIRRIGDTLYRAQRLDIVECLAAMQKAKYVTIAREAVRPRRSGRRRAPPPKGESQICRFTQEYLDKIEAYTLDIWRCALELPPTAATPNWPEVSKAIFDFFRFRCMPEWFLLLRRVLRASVLPEERKREIYEILFSALMWPAINLYISWEAKNFETGVATSSFRKVLMENLKLSESAAEDIVTDLVDVGICGIRGPQLSMMPEITQAVSEYRSEVAREYSFLADYMGAVPVQHRTSNGQPEPTAHPHS
jgi:hypothetical protein